MDKVDSPVDAIDRRILRALQRDSSIANQALADAIGLSPPACLKRVRRLKAARIIERTTAQLSPELLGFPLLTVARVKLNRPTESYLPADLLKLYIYGYLNRVRSSRRLEAETHRNVEVIWLLRPSGVCLRHDEGRRIYDSSHHCR